MTLAELLAQRNTARSSLGALLQKQKAGVSDTIAAAKAKIEAGRNRFFSGTMAPVAGISGNLGVGASASPEIQALAYSKLGRQLSGNLDTRSRNIKNTLASNSFNTAYDEATQASLNESAARKYASTTSTQKKAQDFAANEAALDRESKTKIQDMLDLYNQRGLDMSNSFNANSSFSAGDMLLAQLLGFGTTVGTGFALSKMGQQPTNPLYSNIVGPGDTLRSRSTFIPRGL